MSSERAMMAVCEVLPPMSVAKPSTNFLSSCAVVDGLKSWPTRMHGSVRCRRSNCSLTFEQIVQHAAGEVAHIGGAFAEIFVLHRLQHGDVAVGRGVKGVVGVGLLLADDFDDFLDEHAVFEHQQVRVENVRLGRAHGLGDAALDFGDLLAGADEGLLEAFDFRRDLGVAAVRAGR